MVVARGLAGLVARREVGVGVEELVKLEALGGLPLQLVEGLVLPLQWPAVAFLVPGLP